MAFEKECDSSMTETVEQMKCPCGNPVNSKWFYKVRGNYAIFICECWSGDITEADEPCHIFKHSIKLHKKGTVKT